jgi:hypothetical protein
MLFLGASENPTGTASGGALLQNRALAVVEPHLEGVQDFAGEEVLV